MKKNLSIAPMKDGSVRRLRLTLEYDGTEYAGWQRQINAPSVQQTVEEAFAKLTGEDVRITAASRTDAGVHALGQVAHFDTACRIPAEKLPYALNTRLPPDIRAIDCAEASPSFHARYHACGKSYEYRVHNAAHASALTRAYTAHVPLPLNDAAMREAIPAILGRHDFSAMCAAGGAVRDKRRTIHSADISRRGNEVVLRVSGDGFLYNMVRILAGTLIEIGIGRLPPDIIGKALLSGDRRLLGATAPAKGLCLLSVKYPFAM